MGEEFEYYDAYLKEKVKCIASKNNNRMKMLTHSSHGCWETKVTAGNDFMVVKTWMKGLDCMPMTYMFTRQSWMPRKWNPYQKEGFGQFEATKIKCKIKTKAGVVGPHLAIINLTRGK